MRLRYLAFLPPRPTETTRSGVDQSDDMRRFLWNNHFAAFVGCVSSSSLGRTASDGSRRDAIAFECMPPKIGDQMLRASVRLSAEKMHGGLARIDRDMIALWGAAVSSRLTSARTSCKKALQVGEMFDLEECVRAALPVAFAFLNLHRLSETCQKLGRYTFFFTGLPLNGALSARNRTQELIERKVIGGVSSPPCAQALF